jgi:hypothetical protein
MNAALAQSPALQAVPVQQTLQSHRVWSPDYGQTEDDALDILHYSGRGAAEQWAVTRDWQTEREIAGGREVVVCVLSCGIERRYRVSAAPTVTYTALPE